MSESYSRKRSNTLCENCFFCEKVTEIDENNDISKILDNIQHWDIKDSKENNSLRLIDNYECLVCFFKTNKFIEWKCHIMSISHLAYCHKMNHLYSHVCDAKGCKKILYGSIKSLENHINSHPNNPMSTINSMSICMAGVIKRFIAKEPKPWFYCSFCKINSCTKKHPKQKKKCAKTKLDHCKFCNLTFCSVSQMINYHSLSVEHLTIKCFDELLSKAKNNTKKIKLTESSDKNNEQIKYRTREVYRNNEKIWITIKNTQITKPFKNNKVNTRIQWPNFAGDIDENNDNNMVHNNNHEKEDNLGTTCTDSLLDTLNKNNELVPTTISSDIDNVKQLVYELTASEIRKILGEVKKKKTGYKKHLIVRVLNLLSASSTNTKTLREIIVQAYNSRLNNNHNLQQPPSRQQPQCLPPQLLQMQLHQPPQQVPTSIHHQTSTHHSNPTNSLQTFNKTSVNSVTSDLFLHLPFFKMVRVLWKPSPFQSKKTMNITKKLYRSDKDRRSVMELWNNIKEDEKKIQIILCFFKVGLDNIVHDHVTEQLPNNLSIFVNDHQCELPEFTPVNITQQVDFSQNGKNTIQITWSKDPNKYMVGVFVAQKFTWLDLLVKLQKKPVRPFEKTKELINTSMNRDADTSLESISINVKDPLSKTKMKLPARGADCIHLQCFDAIQFLQLNEQKETWTCPLCRKKTIFERIEVDGLFLKVLQSPNLSEECESVILFKDCSWTENKTANSSYRSKVSDTLSTCHSEIINLTDSDDENITKTKNLKYKNNLEELAEKAEITENSHKNGSKPSTSGISSANEHRENDISPLGLCVITLD